MADNSESEPRRRRRGPGRPFVPGQSGNPGGKTPLTDAVRQAQAMLREATPQAVAKMVELMASDDEKIAHASAKVIIDKAVPDKLDGEAGAAAAAALVSLVVDLGAGKKP